MKASFFSRRPRPSGGALIPALDALRGVAVLAVFAQHLGDTHLPFVAARVAESLPDALAPWVMTVLHHAHWGVDLFFVLSGFSLSQPILARASKGVSAPDPAAFAAWGRSFFVRRAARIYPAYLAALALVIAAAPAVRRHPSFAASLAAHLGMIQGYFTPGGLAIIGAAWSLSTEVTFYLLWPLIAPRILSAPSQRRAAPWLVGLAIVLAAWGIRAGLHDLALQPSSPDWLLAASQRRWAVCRLDQFVLGALAASLHARLVRSPHMPALARTAPVLVATAAVSLVPAFFLEGTYFPEPRGAWPYSLVSMSTALLVLASASVPDRAARWLFPGPLRWVGVVSYGVFLHHQLALGATARLAGPPGTFRALATHAVLALALSLTLGWLSWVGVERPVIERVAELSRRGEGTHPRPPPA